MNTLFILASVISLSGAAENWSADSVSLEDKSVPVYVAQSDVIKIPVGTSVPEAELEMISIDAPSAQMPKNDERIAPAHMMAEPAPMMAAPVPTMVEPAPMMMAEATVSSEHHRGLIKRPRWRIEYEARMAALPPSHKLPRGD